MKKSILYISWFAILSALILMWTAFYWSVYPYNILTVSDLHTDKTEYHRGDTIKYTISYCKNMNVTGQVYRALVNSVRVNFTELTVNANVGCKTVTITDLEVPRLTDNGVYHLEIAVDFKPNPIRTVSMVFKSNYFTIQ